MLEAGHYNYKPCADPDVIATQFAKPSMVKVINREGIPSPTVSMLQDCQVHGRQHRNL